MKRFVILFAFVVVLICFCSCSGVLGGLGSGVPAGTAATGPTSATPPATSTTPATSSVSPITLTLVKAGALAACKSLSNPSAVLPKLDTAQTLLNGGSVLSALENVLQSSLASSLHNPLESALLQTIIDGGALATIPGFNTTSPIMLNSPAGQIVSAGFAGCRIGVGLAATTTKAESVGGEQTVDLVAARYEAVKYLQAHPNL